MNNVKIDFRIKSLDVENNFVTEGEFINNKMKFVDNENNTNYIVLHHDTIDYFKKGNVEMRYRFDLHNTTKGEYNLSGYQLSFEIKTIEMIKMSNKIEIRFNLYQEQELVNETNIKIGYTFL